MSVIRTMSLWLALAATASALGTYPTAFPLPYLDTVNYQVPISPHLVYSTPFADADFRGFSYFNNAPTGGRSEVAFLTGKDSQKALEHEVNLMHNVQKSGGSEVTKKPLDVDIDTKSAGVTSTLSPLFDSAFGSSTAGYDFGVTVPSVSSTETSLIDEKSSVTPATKSGDLPKIQGTSFSNFADPFKFGGAHLIPEVPSGFAAPYPVVRFGGDGSFYPALRSSFEGYPDSSGYGVNYQPYWDALNAYQGYNPFYSVPNNFYNQDYFPSFYNPFLTPSFDTTFKNSQPKAADSPVAPIDPSSTKSSDEESKTDKAETTTTEATETPVESDTTTESKIETPDKSTEILEPTPDSEVPSLVGDSTTGVSTGNSNDVANDA